MKLNFIIILLIHSALARDRMDGGDELNIDDELRTRNNCQGLIMQPDGNLVMYWNGIARWASGTKDSGATVAKMQPDGNFVLYNAQNEAKWSTGTHGNQNSYLVLQDDGNLVVYNSAGSPIWHSNTKKGSEPHYGDFKRDCCKGDDGRGKGVRQYSAILLGISGSWETACRNTPINYNGQFFCQASNCINYGNMYGAINLPDSGCDIDQDWLRKELKNTVGRDFACDWSNWKSDGCSNPVHSSYMIGYSDMFHKACVFHDYCYASPWDGNSNGKKKCDDRFYSLMFEAANGNLFHQIAANLFATGINVIGNGPYDKAQNALRSNLVTCHDL